MYRSWIRAAFAAAFLVIFVTPRPVRGEVRLDWNAWLGCWQPAGADAQDGVVVCMLPGDDAQAIRMLTIAANTIREESVIRADGVARPASEGGCTGQETASWSSDRRRVFIRTELDCGTIDRTATSVMAFVASNEFVDAQAITVNGQHAGRSVRYRAVPAGQVPAIVASELAGSRSLIAETARLDASVAMDVDDVIEAADRIAPPALEALLAARDNDFALDARMLLRLEDAGVPRSVMNVMIAVSNPDYFGIQNNAVVVEEQSADYRPGRYGARDWPECYDPFLRMWRYGSACYNYYSPYRFDDYGYRGRYGYGVGAYFNPFTPRPVVVIVRNDLEQAGEVVKGQGYTSGTGSRTGRAVPRSSTAGSSAGMGSSSSAGSGSSSGSSTTSSGSSSGSSGGTSTGRTAVPRGGRGGGDAPGAPPAESRPL